MCSIHYMALCRTQPQKLVKVRSHTYIPQITFVHRQCETSLYTLPRAHLASTHMQTSAMQPIHPLVHRLWYLESHQLSQKLKPLGNGSYIVYLHIKLSNTKCVNYQNTCHMHLKGAYNHMRKLHISPIPRCLFQKKMFSLSCWFRLLFIPKLTFM